MASLTITEYREALRSFIKDNADLNRLLKFEEENPSAMLDFYIYGALGMLNAVPPLICSFTLGDFPIPILIIHQAAIEALVSNSICAARNELTYNNANVTLKISDASRYQAPLQMLYKQADNEITLLRQIKVSINCDSCWGACSSPYFLLGGGITLRPNSIL